MIRKWLHGSGSQKKNLNRYSRKEKELLFNGIGNFHKVCAHLNYRKGFVDHCFDKYEISLIWDHPDTDWFKVTPIRCIENNLILKRVMNETKKFIFEVPLNKVPLYINSFPELVQWRLIIGK